VFRNTLAMRLASCFTARQARILRGLVIPSARIRGVMQLSDVGVRRDGLRSKLQPALDAAWHPANGHSLLCPSWHLHASPSLAKPAQACDETSTRCML